MRNARTVQNPGTVSRSVLKVVRHLFALVLWEHVAHETLLLGCDGDIKIKQMLTKGCEMRMMQSVENTHGLILMCVLSVTSSEVVSCAACRMIQSHLTVAPKLENGLCTSLARFVEAAFKPLMCDFFFLSQV